MAMTDEHLIVVSRQQPLFVPMYFVGRLIFESVLCFFNLYCA